MAGRWEGCGSIMGSSMNLRAAIRVMTAAVIEAASALCSTIAFAVIVVPDELVLKEISGSTIAAGLNEDHSGDDAPLSEKAKPPTQVGLDSAPSGA